MGQSTKSDYKTEYSRIEEATLAVAKWLSGAGEPICFDQEPGRKYCIGIITPLNEDEEDQDEQKRAWTLRRRPDSIGFEARVQPQAGVNSFEVLVSVSFAIYYRSIPSLDEQRENVNYDATAKKETNDSDNKVHFRQKYKRTDVKVDGCPITINLSDDRTVQDIDYTEVAIAINNALNEAADAIVKEQDCWFDLKQEPTISLSALDSEEAYFKELQIQAAAKKRPNWEVRVSGKLWPAEGKHWRLSILLTNITNSKESKHPVSLFSSRVECGLDGAKYISVPFRAAALDYRYFTKSWGRGINSVLEVNEENSIASTETMPIHKQKRTESRADINDACSFSLLASEEFINALEEVGNWLDGYTDTWRNDNKLYEEDQTYIQRANSLKDFEEEIRRYRFGITALRRDVRLAKSFQLMNEAFAKGEHPGWRLFQLVFIVTQMPSLLAREVKEPELIEELEKVDVLWFPTGGGKTEAYFGVILTAMFYDRLRGKFRGVTAWLRYPLRMLSIQQLQRLADTVTDAESVRKKYKELFSQEGDPFAIGYYVGSKNTPNELTQPGKFIGGAEKPIKTIKTEVDGEANINDVRYLVLQRCPHCKSPNIKLDVDIKALRIRHICDNCGGEAPIYISDSEIYRYVPTIIVGTVDRLARAGQTSLFSHLFGQFDQRCTEHGYLSFGQCIESSVCKTKKAQYEDLSPIYDPCPSLLLQDELHLLKESLGTYDSHYETFMDSLAEEIGSGLPPKRLAATATIEGYQEHVWELYGRKAIRFPVKGMGEYDSAYVQLSENSPIARVYVGIMPTGSSTDEAVSLILQALNNNSNEATKGEWSKPIIDNYDLSLAYVNEKNTAGNLRAQWDEMDDIQILTGDKGLGEVRAVIGRVESDDKRAFDDRLKVIVATSVISHGVDLSRLNFMSFCGMPNHASDYIQASSRVGRTHIGLVFTVFRPENTRERNVYQRFYEYHDRLYQLVQPVPVNRFSESSVSRTFTGLFSACILNILSYKIKTPLDSAKAFFDAYKKGAVKDDDLISLVSRAYAIDRLNLPGTVMDMFNHLVSRLVREQKRVIENNEQYKTYRRMIPLPVSSLREVSEQVEFAPGKSGQWLLNKILEGRGEYDKA